MAGQVCWHGCVFYFAEDGYGEGKPPPEPHGLVPLLCRPRRWFKPHSFADEARCWLCATWSVNAEQAPSGFTDAKCVRKPISTAAAPTFTGSITVGAWVFSLSCTTLLSVPEGLGLCKSVIFLIGITAKAARPGPIAPSGREYSDDAKPMCRGQSRLGLARPGAAAL